ncbi:MAG: GGDEF domain-containing protein [Proteobacteria bacterium]|nr:GGDEF domain-containing protein [Pseudomonadota bacterium]
MAESDFLVSDNSMMAAESDRIPQVSGGEELSKAIGIPPAEMTPHVRKAIVRLLDELERLRVELSETRSRIEYLERLADQDALAPVANRRAFMRELGRTIAYSSRHKIDSSVVYFDLYKMKQINDRYGHAIGDAALLHVASILLKRVRNSDLIGRLGGDEFGLIMPNSDREGAVAKASRIAKEIGTTPISVEGRPLMIDGEAIHVAVSFGVHHVGSADDATSALAKADKAMYVHKRRGSAA